MKNYCIFKKNFYLSDSWLENKKKVKKSLSGLDQLSILFICKYDPKDHTLDYMLWWFSVFNPLIYIFKGIKWKDQTCYAV